MTLKDHLLKKFEFLSDKDFGNYQSDLHILYRKEIYEHLINDFPKLNVYVYTSNVKGHDWYGKRFIEVLFINEQDIL